jgi:hypothetical protein
MLLLAIKGRRQIRLKKTSPGQMITYCVLPVDQEEGIS